MADGSESRSEGATFEGECVRDVCSRPWPGLRGATPSEAGMRRNGAGQLHEDVWGGVTW